MVARHWSSAAFSPSDSGVLLGVSFSFEPEGFLEGVEVDLPLPDFVDTDLGFIIITLVAIVARRVAHYPGNGRASSQVTCLNAPLRFAVREALKICASRVEVRSRQIHNLESIFV